MQLSCMLLGTDEVCVHIHTERVQSHLMVLAQVVLGYWWRGCWWCCGV
jgi:hypothetical protein